MVAPALAGVSIAVVRGGREDPLSAPLAAGGRGLAIECVGKRNATEATGEVAPVELLNAGEVGAQSRLGQARRERVAILLALAASDDELVSVEVDVLDPELETLEEPQTGAVQERGDEPVRALELLEQSPDLWARQDDWELLG
jgi:hypothetical protein